MPDENSIPAFTHLHGGVGVVAERQPVVGEGTSEATPRDCDCGAGPAKMTRPPWSNSISQSALTVTSATTKGCRRDVKTMGAVEVSPLGGLRHRSVLGPAVSSKYSMHWGRVNVDGRLRAVKDELSGGILCAFLSWRVSISSSWFIGPRCSEIIDGYLIDGVYLVEIDGD